MRTTDGDENVATGANEEQEATLARQQKQIDALTIDALTVGLQRVSAQLELTKPAPPSVAG
jgi:hypothetical protein